MTEQMFYPEEPVWTQRAPAATSLGPVDPSWLAKLSAHLGIHAAKTVAPLLMSIWPGTSMQAICCREAAATLLQADTVTVPGLLVEATVKHAFKRRGIQTTMNMNLRSIIEQDKHFIIEQNENDSSDILVRLDKASMPAPAVASLYLAGSGEGMLSAERALYHAAAHLTWPRSLTSDDDYLACQISELLADDSARPGQDRHLPRHSLHLTEVGGALRTRSDTDARLALIFPKGQVAKARRPRLSEFLGKEEMRPYFRIQESKIRASEKVVTLRTDVLLRSLGPMAGLLQKALSPASSLPPSAWDSTTPDAANLEGMLSDSVPLSNRPSILIDEMLAPTPPKANTPGEHGPSPAPFAPSLFFSRENVRSEVPQAIRNCWADAPQPNSQATLPKRIAAASVSLPARTSELSRQLNSATAMDSADGSSRVIGAGNCMGGSTLYSYMSEDLSETASNGVLGTLGASWGGKMSIPRQLPSLQQSEDSAASAQPGSGGNNGSTAAARRMSSLASCTTGATAAAYPVMHNTAAALSSLRSCSSSLNGRAAGVAPDFLSGCPSPHAPAFNGPWGNSIWSNSGAHDGRVRTGGDSGLLASSAGTTGAAGPLRYSEHAWGLITGAVGSGPGAASPHKNPAIVSPKLEATPRDGPAEHVAVTTMPEKGACTMRPSPPTSSSVPDYASVLRSTSGTMPAPPPRREGSPPVVSPATVTPNAPAAASAAVAPAPDAIAGYLEGPASEILARLPPRYATAALADTAAAAPRFMRDERVCRSSLNSEFITVASHLLRTTPSLSTALDGASAAAVRQVMLAAERPIDHSSGAAAAAMSAPASSAALAALKPAVRREIHALLATHAATLRIEHFDSGVVCHLQRRSEMSAAAALREIGRRSDFVAANNKPAYLTHWLLKLTGDDQGMPASSNGTPPPNRPHAHLLIDLPWTVSDTGIMKRSVAMPCAWGKGTCRRRSLMCTISVASVARACTAGRGGASSTKPALGRPDLRRLPRSVQTAIERLVSSSPWVEWRHFDAGVMKVLQQLAGGAEGEALCEIRQVEASELGSVKNMPAYLNKCFNNRLWKVRD